MDASDFAFLVMVVTLFGVMVSMLALESGVIPFALSLGFVGLVISVLSVVYIVGDSSSARERILQESEEQQQSVNPVNTLQEQYANGELTDEEFEEKLDKIVSSQDIADKVDDESMDVLEELEN